MRNNPPSGWYLRPLGEIARINMGQSPESSFYNQTGDGLPLIQGNADCHDRQTLAKTFTSQITKRAFVDDIIMSVRAPVGTIAICSQDSCIGRGVCAIRGTEVDHKYLEQYLIFVESSWNRIGQGSTFAAINSDDIRKFMILFPSDKDVQSKVAKVLSTWDTAINQIGQLIDTKQRFKKGLMQNLLTGKIRLSGHHGVWKEKRLVDLADIDPENLGGNTSSDYKFHYISLEDVDSGRLKSHTSQIFSSAPSRARRKLRKGDVLFATVRPNLKSHLLFTMDAPDWICSTGFAVVRCKDRVACPEYVYFHFFANYVSHQIEEMLTGSNYPSINGQDVRSLRIPVPPSYDEQVAIAKIFITVDAEINQLQRKAELFKMQKKGLMQKLLTGKVRVRV